jgi:hypothetical protein
MRSSKSCTSKRPTPLSCSSTLLADRLPNIEEIADDE